MKQKPLAQQLADIQKQKSQTCFRAPYWRLGQPANGERVSQSKAGAGFMDRPLKGVVLSDAAVLIWSRMKGRQ